MSVDDSLSLHSRNLTFKRIEDFYVVLNIDEPNIVVVDDSGVRLLQLCDGKHTIKEIVDYIHLNYPSAETTREKIMGFISSLIDAGFISTRTFCPDRGVKRHDKLGLLYLALTHECNLQCKHCYASAGSPLQDEMTIDEALGLVKQFSLLGGKLLVLTGGEPFLRRQLLYAVAEEAIRLGIEHINLETNGTLITKEDARFCKRLGLKVGVSLGGATPESHTFIRGKGTFEKALNGIRNLVEEGVDTKIGMTLTSHNLKDAEEIVYLAKKVGANALFLNMVVMMGRAEENPELEVSPKEATSAIVRSRKVAEEVGIRTVFEEVFSDFSSLPKKNMCAAGVGLLNIAANGDVYPCNSFQDEHFKAGNIREQSLAEIWEKSDVLQAFRKLNVLDVPKCCDCELKFICSGGCLAETFRTYKTLTRESPYCQLYKEVYWNIITEFGHRLWKKA